jgi:hypothetical protein
MTFRNFFNRIRKFHKRWLTVALAGIFGALLFIAAEIVLPHRLPAPRSACLNNLRQINGAKEVWALETKADSNAVPAWENIQRYLGRGPQGEIPQCPQGGHYTIGNLQTAPTCSIKGHVLD